MKENSLMPALVARKDNASPAFAGAQVGIPPGFPSLAMVAALVITYHLFSATILFPTVSCSPALSRVSQAHALGQGP